MAHTLTDFDPAAHGLRPAATPIRRKQRTASAKPAPKPQYADAVWYSFTEGKPLEVSVRVSSAEDTVRRLKQAARYLERTHKVEVRVQISVEPELEPVLDASGKPVMDRGQPVTQPSKPPKSLVKFLGHEPWMLGRRISMARLSDTPAGHRKRTPAVTRSARLHDPVVRAVITARSPRMLSFRRGDCGVSAVENNAVTSEFLVLPPARKTCRFPLCSPDPGGHAKGRDY